MTTIIIAIIMFSMLVMVHELGHFVAAKLSGVQVNEFAVFMGPALAKWRWGQTQYSIRCIPIGGYCAMEGENEETDSPRSFQKAAWWKRLIILVAGSFMNFVIGVVLLAIVAMPAKQLLEPVISQAEVGCTVVSEEGLHVGDRFVKVDGERIYVASDFEMILTMKGGDVHDIVVERDGQRVYLNDFVMEKHLFGEETTPRYGFNFTAQEATFGKKLSYVLGSSIDIVRSVRFSLQMLLSGQASVQDVTGPVGIVQMMSTTAKEAETAKDAAYNLIYFSAFIAINLAAMNLLPIPALDGGRVVCLLITTALQAVTKKKVDPKFEGYLHAAGMVLLLLLMAVIMFKDIFFIFKG